MGTRLYEKFREEERRRYESATQKAKEMGRSKLIEIYRLKPQGRYGNLGPRTYGRAADAILKELESPMRIEGNPRYMSINTQKNKRSLSANTGKPR